MLVSLLITRFFSTWFSVSRRNTCSQCSNDLTISLNLKNRKSLLWKSCTSYSTILFPYRFSNIPSRSQMSSITSFLLSLRSSIHFISPISNVSAASSLSMFFITHIRLDSSITNERSFSGCNTYLAIWNFTCMTTNRLSSLLVLTQVEEQGCSVPESILFTLLCLHLFSFQTPTNTVSN